MIGIDTNVLLRLFVIDDPQQCAAARRLVADHASEGVFLATTVLAEFVRVHRRKLKRPHAETAMVLARILQAPEFVVEDQSVVEEAFHAYQDGRTDFSDCLIVAQARAAGAGPVFTFDAGAAQHIPGAELVVRPPI